MSTEVNLMQCVVKAVAVLGFENASMKTIAKNAGISPSTIYCHFDSKESMFEATFMYLAKELCEFYSKDHASLADTDQRTSVRRLWDRCLNFFFLKWEECLFFVRYRHSAYYTEEIQNRVLAFESGYRGHSEDIAMIFGFEAKNGCASIIMRYFVETTLLYAEQRILGKAQPIHDDVAFETVYGSLLTLEKALVKNEQPIE